MAYLLDCTMHTWCVSSSKSLGSSILCKLEHSPLTIWTSTQNGDVLWVLDSYDHSSRQLKLLPSFGQIDYMDAILPPLVDVPLHLEIAILCSQMALCCQHKLDIRLLLRQRHGCNSPVKRERESPTACNILD